MELRTSFLESVTGKQTKMNWTFEIVTKGMQGRRSHGQQVAPLPKQWGEGGQQVALRYSYELKWRTVFKHEFLSETLPCKVSN
jgi:hypothetical protein